MKHSVVLIISSIWASVFSAPHKSIPQLINSENALNADGNYYYKYSLDNGVMQVVAGKLKNINDTKVYTVVGSYAHPSDNGGLWVVEYIADETGFHAMVSLRGGSPVMTDIVQMATFLRAFHKRYFRRKFIIF